MNAKQEKSGQKKREKCAMSSRENITKRSEKNEKQREFALNVEKDQQAKHKGVNCANTKLTNGRERSTSQKVV